MLHESLERANKTREDLKNVGSELRYTRETVAEELSGWQAGHARRVRRDLVEYAKRNVIIERDRLQAFKRVMRDIQKYKDGEKTDD